MNDDPIEDEYAYALFAKVKDSTYGKKAEAEIFINKSGGSIGSSPEITTSSSSVTYKGVFDVVGTIEEPSSSSVTVIYGVDLYKQTWWGWSLAGHCNNVLFNDGSVNINNKTIQCAKSNSGTNTYRVVATAEAIAQTFGTSSSVYADFYTGSNRIVVDSISIS